MPVIFIYGTSKRQFEKLEEFKQKLIEEVILVKELGLTDKDVSVFFPEDQLGGWLSKELIIFVDGLLTKPERTDEVRENLAKKIVETTKYFWLEQYPSLFHGLNIIECFVRPFDKGSGFSCFTSVIKN